MADLNARIKPKKSSTTGEVPQAADLEVAEIAVNTADGKLFVKHTDNSIKEISGGTDITTESIDALSDVDTSTTPPTDGQVLTWVGANNQWEPADAPADAITSVNSQTGVVNLDLSDLGDVKPTFQRSVWTTRNTGTNITCGSSDAHWNIETPGGWPQTQLSIVDSNGNDLTSVFNTLLPDGGDVVRFYDPSDDSLIATITLDSASAPQYGFCRYDLLFNVGGDPEYDKLVAYAGTSIYVSVNDVVIGVSAPVTDGQVLTWDNAAGQWEPADAAGGTVSTLGEIGDVTDYLPFSSIGAWDQEIVTTSNAGTDYPNAAGEWACYESSITPGNCFLMLHFTDSNAVDHTSLFNAVTASATSYSFRLKANGATLDPIVPLTGASAQADGRYRFDFDISSLDPATFNEGGYGGGVNGSSNGPFANTLEIDLQLTTNFGIVPQDGQVLTWVSANSQWEPVDSVESVTDLSNVSYNFDNPPSWNITLTADQQPGMTSGAGYEANGALAVSPFSSQGDDLKTDVRAWVATLTFPVDLTYVFDGVKTVINTTGTTDQWNDTGSYRPRFFFNSATFTSDFHAGQSLYIKEFVEYQGATAAPPLDGEVLVYNTANSEWQPGAVAFGDVNGVDVSTTPPTDGQVLTWVDTNSQWEPADAAGGGAVDSVNGQTGVVSLALPDLTDTYPSDDPLYSQVSLLLEGESGDGTVPVDTSLNGFTRVGGTATVSTAQFKSGTGSIFFNGSSTTQRYTADAALQFGSDDFTIETWVYFNDTSAASFFSSMDYYGVQHQLSWYFTSGVMYVDRSSDGTTVERAQVNWTPSTGQWYHIAIAQEGANFRIFIDGNTEITANYPNGLYASNETVIIGGTPTSSSTVHILDGYIDNYRVTKGTARYTTNFTPPESAGGVTPSDGQVLTWVTANNQWEPGDYISKATLKAEVAAATDFADFQSRIAAL